jgi:hypothetical protein
MPLPLTPDERKACVARLLERGYFLDVYLATMISRFLDLPEGGKRILQDAAELGGTPQGRTRPDHHP